MRWEEDDWELVGMLGVLGEYACARVGQELLGTVAAGLLSLEERQSFEEGQVVFWAETRTRLLDLVRRLRADQVQQVLGGTHEVGQ